MEFLTNTSMARPFVQEVIDVLVDKKISNHFSETQEILGGLIEGLKDQVAGIDSPGRTAFRLVPNEYNFLSQHSKALWVDYLFFRYKFRIYPELKRFVPFPMHILVEPVSRCNLKCLKCFQSDYSYTSGESQGTMEEALFKSIVDQAVKHGNRALTISGRGEPLIHPGLGRMLSYTAGKFYDVKLNTNALLLYEEKSRIILESGVTELVFSVDAANDKEYARFQPNGDLGTVIENIERFNRIRADYPSSFCRTRVSGVAFNPDFDDIGFKMFWQPKADNVCVVPAVNIRDAYTGPVSKAAFACPLLWQRIYIWFDGTVNPCDFDYKSRLKAGNVSIKRMSIKDIWNGPVFESLRAKHLQGERNLFIPCNRCARTEN